MQSRDRYRIALLSAYALALHGIETLVPMPVPWLRAGLSNIITLTALSLFGLRAAMMVTLIRVTISSIFTGSFLGPGFILSMGGGVSGTLAMGLLLSLSPRMFSPVGLSLAGALFHNLAQLFFAYLLFIRKIEPVVLVTPVLLLIGTMTGLVNGIAADLLIRSLKNSPETLQNSEA